MKDPDLPHGHSVSHKVEVDLHMLGPLMLNWVGGEVHGADVVAVHNGGAFGRSMQLCQKLPQPAGLSNTISDRPVFSLCT